MRRHCFTRPGPALALLGLLVWSVTAFAEPPVRIGFFDLNRVHRQTGVQARAQEEFETRLKERKKALGVIQKELEQLNEQLRREAATLSPERRQEQDAAIQRKFEELKRDKEGYEKELLALDRTVRARVWEAVAQAVKAVAQEQGYAAILEGRQAGVYFLDKGLDLTDAIVQRIKAKLEAAPAPALETQPGSEQAPAPPPSQK